MNSSKEFVTPEEVADWLRVPVATIYKLAREGVLPGFKVGRHWRFRNEAIEQWVLNRERTSIRTENV
jgi:excisionase family DNA binding protein